MAKLKGALHSDSASGAFNDGMIFRKGKRGCVLTKYYKPGQVNKFICSPAQIARREAYRLGMALWNSLTAQEKEYWNLLEKEGSVIVY